MISSLEDPYAAHAVWYLFLIQGALNKIIHETGTEHRWPMRTFLTRGVRTWPPDCSAERWLQISARLRRS